MAEQEFTTEELQSEQWRDVVGFRNDYFVSSLGRVRARKRRGTGGAILKSTLDRGYPFIILTVQGQGYGRHIHRLVAESFIGERPAGHEVNHIDGKKFNNRVTNLEYITHQQNIDHAIASGLMNPRRSRPSYLRRAPSRRGQDSPIAKLRNEDVLNIRAKLANGVKGAVIAREFGVSSMTISMIKTGKNWTHI